MKDYSPPKSKSSTDKAQFTTISLPKFTIYHKFENGQIAISIKVSDATFNLEDIQLENTMLSASRTNAKYRFQASIPILNTSQPLDKPLLDSIFQVIRDAVLILSDQVGSKI